MARLAFVEEQGRFFPGAARRQVVSVEIEGAWTRAVGCAAVVAAAGFELLAVSRIRPDRQRRLRHRREEARDLRVDLLLKRVIILRDLVAALRLEARVGPH